MMLFVKKSASSLLVNKKFFFSNSVCFTAFPKRYNDHVIETCLLSRQSVEDVDIDTTRTLSSYNIVVTTHKKYRERQAAKLESLTVEEIREDRIRKQKS